MKNGHFLQLRKFVFLVHELAKAGVSAVSHDTQVLSPGYLHLSVSVLPTRSRKDCLRSE